MDGTQAPSDEPLRLFVETDAGISGLRLPYVSVSGAHGFSFPEPSQPGDQNSFAINTIARYFQLGGTELPDDPCMSDFGCSWIPELDINSGEE